MTSRFIFVAVIALALSCVSRIVAADVSAYAPKPYPTVDDRRDWVVYSINKRGHAAGSVAYRASDTDSASQAFEWNGQAIIPLDTSGAVSSQAWGINSADEIAGAITNSAGKRIAVVWRDGQRDVVDVLGGKDSGAHAINDAGVIVGDWSPKPGATRIFVCRNGVAADVGGLPGCIRNTPLAINATGDYVGVSLDAHSNLHGFVCQHGKLIALTVRGAHNVYPTQIADNGDVVGLADDKGDALSDPILWHKGVATRLAIAAGRLGLVTRGAVAISAGGQFVYSCTVAGTHGGLPVHGLQTVGSPVATKLGDLASMIPISIAVNDASQTIVSAIPDGGADPPRSRAYIVQGLTVSPLGTFDGPPPPSKPPAPSAFVYSLADLGVATGFHATVPMTIDQFGRIAGTCRNPAQAAGDEAPFIVRSPGDADGASVALLSLPATFSSANAHGINANGWIVGNAVLKQHSRYGQVLHAGFICVNGHWNTIGSLGGANTYISAVNDLGQIVGASQDHLGHTHGYVYQHGVLMQLEMDSANAVSGHGMVAGMSRDASGVQQAIYWNLERTVPIGRPPNAPASAPCVAVGVNDAGQVAGYCGDHAFIWQGGTFTDLGVGRPYGINASGKVVGIAPGDDGQAAAAIWVGGQRIDLNICVPPGSGIRLIAATAINENGMIVATGRYAHPIPGYDDDHGFVLTPWRASRNKP